MLDYTKANSEYKYMVLIDILSRYAWTTPLKSLKAEAIIKALKLVIKHYPQKLRSDPGTEYNNRLVKAHLSDMNTHYISLQQIPQRHVTRRG